MKDPKKIYQMLGMAARARMLIMGEDLVVREIRAGNARLVIVSEDASSKYDEKIN